MIKKQPVIPALGAFLRKCQKERLVNGKHVTNHIICDAAMLGSRTYNYLVKGQTDNINQLHAVMQFWRSTLTTEKEREKFEQELALCLESDLRQYRLRTGVLKE